MLLLVDLNIKLFVNILFKGFNKCQSMNTLIRRNIIILLKIINLKINNKKKEMNLKTKKKK